MTRPPSEINISFIYFQNLPLMHQNIPITNINIDLHLDRQFTLQTGAYLCLHVYLFEILKKYFIKSNKNKY